MKSINSNRNFVIQNMRVILTLLVVLHHVTMTYTTHSIAALVIDPSKAVYANYIVGLLDKFFMSAFFMISGMFVWNSMKRKGTIRFLLSRVVRLGVPFVIGWLILNVPAYYISYISGIKQSTDPTVQLSGSGFIDFLKATFGLGVFSGHLWFLWVLLAFNIVVVIMISVVKIFWKKEVNIPLLKKGLPTTLILLLLLFMAYYPMASVGNGWFVTIYGPLVMQLNRVLLYFAFYLFGLLVGAQGIQNTFLNPEGKFVKFWWLHVTIALITYVIVAINTTIMFTDFDNTTAVVIVNALYVFVALFMTLGIYSFIACYSNKDNRLMRALSRDAFGIYVFHYSIVTFWQYIFLEIELNVGAKILSVLLLSLAASWLASKLVRSILSIGKQQIHS